MKIQIFAPVSILFALVSSCRASKPLGKKAAFIQKVSNTGNDFERKKIHQEVHLSDELNAIVDKALIDDIEMLSAMLSTVVKKENPRVYDLYTQLRKHGIDRAADPNNTEAFEKMKKLSFDISPQDALGVMRVFSVALNLVNAAEVHHRMRVMRQTEFEASKKNSKNAGPLPMVEDSVRGTLDLILDEEENVTKDDIFRALLKQKVEIVITAHPTEGSSTVEP